MPETSMPPPPKHGGGGAFIGAVILMLLAMGGLLYWKFGGKDTARPAPSAFATVAPPPQFDEAPPPPPPIEPDAGKKDDAPAKKRLVASAPGAGGCAAVCKGDAPAGLRSELGGAASSVRGCYERALRQNAMLQGKLVVSVKVGPQGSTCSAALTSDTLGDPGVSTCVLQQFRTRKFSAPVGGCVDVNVPISFMPKTK